MITDTFKVLLVEDVLTNARTIEHMLGKCGRGRFQVQHTMHLRESTAALQVGDFDVILLDLNLPDSEGLDTLARVAEVAPEVPVIVITATQSEEIGVRAVRMGAQDFLVKGAFNETFLHRALLHAMERHRLQRTIRKLAVMDELTGLYNRRGFNSLYLDVQQRAMRSNQQGFLFYFDLDHLKKINDECGHQKGDEALAEFAAALRTVFRKDTLLARFGGDEFIAMGLETQAGQAPETLRVLKKMLAERNESDRSGYSLETSSGLAYFGRTQPATIEQLIEAADTALYRDKHDRKGRQSHAARANTRATA